MLIKLFNALVRRGPAAERRRLSRTSPRPKKGQYISRQNLMMHVNHSMPGELWDWMLALGWRSVPADNRRRYHRMDNECFTALRRADVFTRDDVHTAILQRYPGPELLSEPQRLRA